MQEAQNIALIGENLREFELIQIPRPIGNYCSRRVLTMDQIEGTKITRLSPLTRQLDLNGDRLAEQLFQAIPRRCWWTGYSTRTRIREMFF